MKELAEGSLATQDFINVDKPEVEFNLKCVIRGSFCLGFSNHSRLLASVICFKGTNLASHQQVGFSRNST